MKLDVSCHLRDVCTRFQIHISKRVEKSSKKLSECLWQPGGQKLPSHDENQCISRYLLCKCVYQIWRPYIIAETINEEKIFGCKVGRSDLIVMKPDLNVWHCLLDVYTKFQIDISKQVKKSPENFRWLGALLTPASECFGPPEGQKLPNHDKNQ